MSNFSNSSKLTIDTSNIHFYIKEYYPENGTLLGFWIYLMSDCLLFASLFVTYAVLGRNYVNGPTGIEIFHLHLVALNTALLLISSMTYSFAILQIQKEKIYKVLIWLGITGLLGISFLYLEIQEFLYLIYIGASPKQSGFLTSFFALVGTHGLHVAFGIIWLIILMIQINKYGLTLENNRRIVCLSMFWHFLDIIWIGVFTFVYLLGVL